MRSAEIKRWIADGWINRVGSAGSRDRTERVYVQQRLRGAKDESPVGVDAGVAVHVCGSLNRLATGVDAALPDVLGVGQVEQLREQGHYRRDVY